MARNVNKVFLLGNVTETPELKHTRGGTAVTNFSLATNESYKDSEGEWQEKAQFHNITAWGKQAELITDLVQKGQQMHVEGSNNYGSYTKEVGGEEVTIPTTEVKLREFTLTGGRPNGAAPAANTGSDDDLGDEDEDDLPF